MFKRTFAMIVITGTMLGNTMIGFGGLKVFDMSKEDQKAYILSGENPVSTLAISDQGDGYFEWITIQDK